MSAEERFWAKVDKRGPDECWEWEGCRHPRSGHGRITLNYVNRYAHRHAWELTNGPVPEGLHVLHHCDNGPCCNPAHLFLGTHSDNMADMCAKGRHRGGAKAGHSWAPKGSRHPWAKLTEDQVRRIRSRYAAGGVTQSELGADYGVSGGTISRIVRGAGWKSAGPGVGNNFKGKRCARGSNQGSAKLTDRKVTTLRAFYAAGTFTQKELAAIYEINPSNVSRIVRQEAWQCAA